MKRFYILASALLLAISAVPVSAAPGFPACSSPEGPLKVSYESGWHGIIGTGANHEGSDSVYTINGSQLLQCFCPAGDNDAGTQTDWWKISGLSESEINAYRLQGWVFVPSGLDWGLDDASFLAKNSSFDCKENPPGPSANPSRPRAFKCSPQWHHCHACLVRSPAGYSLHHFVWPQTG